MSMVGTKRIQPTHGWCATVGGIVQIVSTYPASPEARPPSFWGSQPCVPAAWLAERLLLAGDIESNPGLDLWMSPERVVPLLVRWKRRLAGLLLRNWLLAPPQLHAGGVGDNNNNMSMVVQVVDTAAYVWCPRVKVHILKSCLFYSSPIFFVTLCCMFFMFVVAD